MRQGTRSPWIKWTVGTIIAIVGAGGGLVAGLRYIDDRQERAEREYQAALEAWNDFAPPREERRADQAELLGGWHLDLDRGLVAMSLTGPVWDLRFHVDRSRSWVGIEANSLVEWSDLGTVDFDSLSYRRIRDARLTSVRPGRDDKFLYYAHITAAPGPGYVFVVRTPNNNVAKVEIVRYVRNAQGVRGAVLRYETFPIVADPPRPIRR